MTKVEPKVELAQDSKTVCLSATRIGKALALPKLVIASGPKKGAVLQLNQSELTIGRDIQTGLCIADNSISRKQCIIKADRGTYLISDCNSLNGSFVNDVAIREKVLQHGDLIRLGSTELVFLEEEDDAALANRSQDSQALDMTRCVSYPAASRRSPELRPLERAPRRFLKAAVPAAIAPPSTELSPVEASASLAQFTKILRKQRWKLLTFVCVAMAGAVAVQFAVPKVYEATAVVKVDRHTVGGVVGQEASQVSSVDDMDQIITTQIEMAQSDPVLRPVAERYNLLATEKSVKSGNSKATGEPGAAPIELNGLKISRPPNTYLVRISYRAHDPQLAANVANAVAQSLTEHANDTVKNSYEQVSALVAQDMTALRTKMESSAKQLAEFEKQLNMVDPSQRSTILTARLSQINTEFTAAQEERIRREAILAQVNGSQSLASAQTAQAAAQDTLLNEAIQRLNTARQQFALARSYYGEGHPEFAKAQKQVQEVQSQVDELQARAKDRARAEYRQALERENRLHSVVQQTKAEGDGLRAVALQYEQLRSEAENDKKIYEDLATRTRIAGINQQFQNATVQIAARALVPAAQIFPKLLINLALALIISGVLGILIAVLANALDTTLSDSDEVASQLHVNVIAAIPAAKLPPNLSPNLAAVADSSKRSAQLISSYDEAIRTVRTALNLASTDRPIRSVLVTSAVPGEGKSTTAAHLAMAYAQIGRKVLLIDANFRRPALHKIFSEEDTTGFADVLQGKRSYADAIRKSEQPGLFVMPAGPLPRRATDLIGIGFSKILDKLRREFDLIIIDAPHVLGASETQELAGIADGVLLLTKASATNGKLVSEALSTILRTGANLIGLVMNQVKPSAAAGYPHHYDAKVGDAKSVACLGA
jgi:succinoglycan biosynthesis transport protein ExoP